MSSAMSSGWDLIKAAVAEFISRPSPQPPFVGAVEADGRDGLDAGQEFVPEASYFGVRIVDMRLAEGGKYFVDFLPMGVCVAEYTYGTERHRVPLVLNNEKVKQMLGDAAGDPGHVQFTNMPVVRRAPVKHDNLALFVGLFRVPFSDIAHSVLQLAADVSEDLGGAATGATAGVATKLYDRVTAMFSLSSVQPRFAFMDGMALTKSGYILISGPLPAETKGSDFIVADNRLRRRGDSSGRAPEDFDYCVLAIEQTGSLFPAAGTAAAAGEMLRALAALPFHQRWQAISKLLAQRKAADAEEALLALRAEVVTSPDLSEEDRLIAIGGYDLAYAQYERPLLARPGNGTGATRGMRSGTAVTGLRTYAESRETQGDTKVAAALNGIALRLQTARVDSVPADGVPDDALAAAMSGVRNTMSTAWKAGLRPQTLANALAAATQLGG